VSEVPQVYSHFASSPEWVTYLNGKWKGSGLHGVPELDSSLPVQLTIRTKKSETEFAFAIARKSSGFDAALFEPILCPFADWSVSADAAEFHAMERTVFIQALSRKECYVLIRSDGSGSRILFGGTVNKKGFR